MGSLCEKTNQVGPHEVGNKVAGVGLVGHPGRSSGSTGNAKTLLGTVGIAGKTGNPGTTGKAAKAGNPEKTGMAEKTGGKALKSPQDVKA
jgi:hypothetical protein